MPTILAPTPRPLPQHSQLLADDRTILVRHVPPFSHPQHPIHSRTPRLLSPIRLHDHPLVRLPLPFPPSLTCCPQSSKSPTPRGPSHKRRSASRLVRSSRRRRHAQRVDSPFDAFGRPCIFDQLPWVSALEMPSPPNCDIADLSQLPLDEDLFTVSDTMPASGPVRRRKTSLRSNPLGSGPESPPAEPLLRQHPPTHRSTGPLPGCPRTPPPHIPFDPSRVTFQNLMPVFTRGVNPSTPF